MSTFNVKSTMIANRDSSPKVLTDAVFAVGVSKSVTGVESLPQTAAAGSYAKLVTVPSSAKLATLEYCSAALGTSAIDMAVWYPTNVPSGAGLAATLGGTLISSSAIVSNLAGIDTAVAWTDAFGTISNFGIAKRSYMLWQILGLTTDPLIDLDIGFSVRTANAIAGYVGIRAMFVE